MKKLMCALAAVAAGVAVADVTSANIVGYSSSAYEANKNFIIGAQFEATGADSTVSLDELLKPTTIGYYGEGDDERMHGAPMIMDLVDGAYDYYYFINDATLDEEHDYEPVEGNHWADRDGILLTADQLKTIGDGFWLRMSGDDASDATCAGQVSDADTFEIPLEANLNKIVCNPFPLVVDYSKVTFTDGIEPGYYGEGDDERMHGAPMIMDLVDGAYDYYYFINDATLDEEHDYEPVAGDNWTDRDGIILTEAQRVRVGGGFWIRTAQAGKIKFER